MISLLYTKGDRETVIRRFDMIHTLTMFCPIVDEGIKIFKNNLLTCLTQYMEKKDYFKTLYTIENGMILSPIVRQNSNVGKMFNSISVSSNNIPPSPNMSNRTNGIAQNVVNA